MKEKVHKVKSKLYPIYTEAPWSIDNKERSNHYIHNLIDRVLFQSGQNVRSELEGHVTDVEIGWK